MRCGCHPCLFKLTCAWAACSYAKCLVDAASHGEGGTHLTMCLEIVAKAAQLGEQRTINIKLRGNAQKGSLNGWTLTLQTCQFQDNQESKATPSILVVHKWQGGSSHGGEAAGPLHRAGDQVPSKGSGGQNQEVKAALFQSMPPSIADEIPVLLTLCSHDGKVICQVWV